MRNLAAASLSCLLIVVPGLTQTSQSVPWNDVPHEAENATKEFSPQLRTQLAQLRDAALADNYAYQELEHLTDSIGPRPQGSPQADAAVHYVAEELRRLGLEVRLEP